MRTPLGQNFLIDESIAERIAKSANLAGQNVLEIGPGKGILTKYLAEYAGNVLAVEIDEKLAEELCKKFNISSVCHPCESRDPENDNYRTAPWIPHQVRDDKTMVQIIEGDFLKMNLPKIIEENDFQNYKVVANLPYYITSKIIRLLLETQYPPSVMILMVQKEVGERIVALDGKESILSISVKLYADPEILFNVPREKFLPIPEVDSVVIKIKRKNKVPDVDINNFFRIVRAGFSSKRKMLVNNLLSSLKIPKEDAVEKIKKSGLNPEIRAEKLGLEDWIRLYRILD